MRDVARAIPMALALVAAPGLPAPAAAAAATPAAAPRPLPQPVAAYAPFLLMPGAAGRQVDDIEVVRERDGAAHVFAFVNAKRDLPGITAFLGGGIGRVTRVFDQAQHHDLAPAPGTRGPMIEARSGELVFDNGGGFEGNPPADGKPWYAVELRAEGFALDLAHGVTVVASLRVGDIASIGPAPFLSLDPKTPSWLALLAGFHPPARNAAGDDRTSLVHGSIFPVGAPLAATPNTLSVTLGQGGSTAIIDGTTSELAQHWPQATWSTLELGTTTAGGGAGWALGSLLVFDRSLAPDDVARATRALRVRIEAASAPVIVLDGDSIDAGAGSTRLHNLAFLYGKLLPGTTVFDVAVGGATAAARLAALPATLQCFDRAEGAEILVDGAGANSLARGVGAAETYAEATRYIAEARAARPRLKIGLATIIPMRNGTVAGHAEDFAAYNAMVRGNRAGADFIIDRTADPVMGAEETVFPHIDRRYSTDGVHPTDAGTSLLAAIDVRAIAAALGRTVSAAPTD